MAKIPVKVFRSTDKDAPVLSAKAGAFKTVLKACLVTGYGNGEDKKEPLGWEIVGEETETSVAVRPTSLDSGRHIFKCADNTQNTALSAYFDLDADGNLVEEGKIDNPLPFSDGGNTTNEWLLVGHERAFFFAIKSKNSSKAVSGYYGSGMFFGDIVNRTNNSRGNTLLCRVYTIMPVFDYPGRDLDFFSKDGCIIASNYDGTKKWEFGGINRAFGVVGQDYSPLSNELFYTLPMCITENIFRGVVPFGYFVNQALPHAEYFKEIDDLQGHEGQKFLLYNATNNPNNPSYVDKTIFLLINLSEWEV